MELDTLLLYLVRELVTQTSEVSQTSDVFGYGGVTSGWEADKRIRSALSANPLREAIRWSSFVRTHDLALRIPHGDGITRANIRSPCGLAPSVFTCVRVYLSTWFPAARLTGLPVSIPRPRESRPDMSHPRRD